MPDFSKMGHDDFDRILREIVHEDGTESLLSIPGVYEIVQEHYNNDVLDRWAEEQE